MTNWLGLNGKTVIVTGGSSGIGKSITLSLLENGAKVVVADIKAPTLEMDEKDLRDRFRYIETDVTSRDSVSNMVAAASEQFESIDGLVNNAGINIPRLLIDADDESGYYELDDEVFDRMISINHKGVFLCSQIVGRTMVKQGSGVIVNIASESGLEGSEGQSCYAATKAAVYSYTRSWAKELGKHGVRVVGVSPGILEETALRTEAYEEALAYTRNISVEKLRSSYENVSIPIGRVGKLSEVADMVSFLLSRRASYVTGTVYNISGGKSRA